MKMRAQTAADEESLSNVSKRVGSESGVGAPDRTGGGRGRREDVAMSPYACMEGRLLSNVPSSVISDLQSESRRGLFSHAR